MPTGTTMTGTTLLKAYLDARPEEQACVSPAMLAEILFHADAEAQAARRAPQVVIDDPAGFIAEMHDLVTRRPRGRPRKPAHS
jgi:hypothetical protein